MGIFIAGIILGSTLLYQGGQRWLRIRYLRTHGVKTRARVIENHRILETEDIEKLDDDVFKTTYSPILEFETLTGEKHIVTDLDNTKSSKHRIGKEYQIIYNPEDKNEFELETEYRYTVSGILMALGLCSFLGAIYYYLYYV